ITKKIFRISFIIPCLLCIAISFAQEIDKFSCNFEVPNSCQWTQDASDDFNWTRHQGRTESPHTGPLTDHTKGLASGWYLYIETSPPRQLNDKARLISPSTTKAKSRLLFFYHMYGADVRELRVYVKSGGKMDSLWSLSGDQGDKWYQAQVAVNNQTASYQFVIEGVRGKDLKGDIAIDDITLMDSYSGREIDKFSCNFEVPNSCQWAQDSSDDFNWTRHQGGTPSVNTGPSTDHTRSSANVLRTFDNDKAHGPDGIPAHLLTETASQIAPSLCQLFNKSLRIGVVPSDWKLANVVPAHKKGDQEFVEHYRPISLLPLVSKVLERCVFNTIKDHIFCRINPCQHGFLPGKNCVTQLIEVFDKIGKQLDRGKQIDVIYFDMSKAFDKVSHKRLLLRLREFGFGGNILNWFRSYLQDRRQQTTILGATSLPSQVISGVSQGSILGPVLFLLCENDLPSSVKNSSIATYADDTKIFKEIHNIGDAASLQEDLSNFESSSSDMGLHLNTSKCKALRVTGKHRKIKYPYTLQDSMLENVENERDLCVWISNNLTWRKQVLEQCSKANKMLGFIKRSTRTIKN
ncbi:RNA-directed DNA polymerase from mobile element jockey, partial [Paramuricea clavata]